MRALAVLYLTGELGAGKTTLARGFLRARGFSAAVRSPTYTLLELYRRDSRAAHGSYRLRDASELESLGLREWALPDACGSSSGPSGPGRLPPPDLTLSLSRVRVPHDIDVRAHSALGKALAGGADRRRVVPLKRAQGSHLEKVAATP